VLCITGNGLKTTDALADCFEASDPIAPRLAAFEEYLERHLEKARPTKGVA
jgi:threonine synthase